MTDDPNPEGLAPRSTCAPVLRISRAVNRAISSPPPRNLCQRCRRVLRLPGRHLGEQRHAEDAIARTLGVREAARAVPEAGVGGLQMDGLRVVNRGLHATRLEGGAD